MSSYYLLGSNISPFFTTKQFGAVNVVDTLNVGGTASLSSVPAPVVSISSTGAAPLSAGAGSLVGVKTGQAEIDLPPVSSVAGWQGRFLVGSTLASTTTIKQNTADSTAEIYGHLVSAATGAQTIATVGSTITLTTSAVVGDSIFLTTDGTKWYFAAQTQSPAAVTLA